MTKARAVAPANVPIALRIARGLARMRINNLRSSAWTNLIMGAANLDSVNRTVMGCPLDHRV